MSLISEGHRIFWAIIDDRKTLDISYKNFQKLFQLIRFLWTFWEFEWTFKLINFFKDLLKSLIVKVKLGELNWKEKAGFIYHQCYLSFAKIYTWLSLEPTRSLYVFYIVLEIDSYWHFRRVWLNSPDNHITNSGEFDQTLLISNYRFKRVWLKSSDNQITDSREFDWTLLIIKLQIQENSTKLSW